MEHNKTRLLYSTSINHLIFFQSAWPRSVATTNKHLTRFKACVITIQILSCLSFGRILFCFIYCITLDYDGCNFISFRSFVITKKMLYNTVSIDIESNVNKTKTQWFDWSIFILYSQRSDGGAFSLEESFSPKAHPLPRKSRINLD